MNDAFFDSVPIEDDDVSFINKNKTDYDRFRNFRERFDARVKSAEKGMQRESAKRSVETWDRMTPDRWSGASLAKVDPMVSSRIKSSIDSSEKPLSYYVHGEPGYGKTYAAHAIVRRMVARKNINPFKVLIVSESEIMAMANGGFKTEEKFEKLLDKEYSAVIFDGVGNVAYTNKELSVLERFVDKLYNVATPVVFTSNFAVDEWVKEDFDESIASKIRNMVENRVFELSVKPEKSNH